MKPKYFCVCWWRFTNVSTYSGSYDMQNWGASRDVCVCGLGGGILVGALCVVWPCEKWDVDLKCQLSLKKKKVISLLHFLLFSCPLFHCYIYYFHVLCPSCPHASHILLDVLIIPHPLFFCPLIALSTSDRTILLLHGNMDVLSSIDLHCQSSELSAVHFVSCSDRWQCCFWVLLFIRLSFTFCSLFIWLVFSFQIEEL